jgi:cysteine-rich repeat protein
LAAALWAAGTPACGQSFNPGDVFWGGSFTPAQLVNASGGGDFGGVTPLATLAGRTIGQMAWSPDRMTLYVTLFALDRVDAVTAAGAQSIYATGLSSPTGLLTTRDGRLLVANFSGSVVDITGGGDFTGAPAFASGLAGPRNLVQLDDDRILIATQTNGRVIDITAGGNFGADPGFAFGLSSPLDLVQDALGRVFVSESSALQVTDITAGGDFTGVAPFASGRQFAGLAIDGSARLLAGALVSSNAWDITAGGNFAAVAPWAFNLPIAETAFDAVPVIVCGDNQVDPGEQCDDGNTVGGDCCSPTCTYDPLNSPCADDGQACTLDRCDGAGACTHPAGNGGAVCRPLGGTCDLAESCDGVSPTCPADEVRPLDFVCRSVAGLCDVAESCDGVSPACPVVDDFEANGFTCRGAADLCDAVESCTGSSPACPPDALLPDGSLCRGAVDLCDAEETCNGAAVTCPADDVLPLGSECRTSSDLCDAAEQCDGMTTACPPDVLSLAGTGCRPVAGVCDVAETCTGDSPACPADAKSMAECRAAAGPCDLAESCTGMGNTCPPDVLAPDGTGCSDGAFCNGAEECQSGACAAPSTPCSSFCDENGDMCVIGCPPGPQPCRTSTKSFILVRRGSDPALHKLLWKWIKGAATGLDELGDPTASTDYALCLYGGTPPLLLAGGELEVPADSSRWSAVRTGFQFVDSTASVAGANRIKLRAGNAGRSKMFVKGKGAALPDPTLPLADPDLPVIVQLLNSSTTACWQSAFGAGSVITNTDALLKARTP